jgi:hypothetical protein
MAPAANPAGPSESYLFLANRLPAERNREAMDDDDLAVPAYWCKY